MRGIGATAGEALRRAPYAWLISTLALMVVMLSPLSVLAKDSDEASTGLAVGALAVIVYELVVVLVIAPRRIYPRLRNVKSEEEVAMLRWAFALTPFLIGYGAVAAGAKQWSLSAGFLASVTLLVAAARSMRRDEPEGS